MINFGGKMQRLKYEKYNNSSEGFFNYYKYEMKCFDIGNDFAESECLNAS